MPYLVLLGVFLLIPVAVLAVVVARRGFVFRLVAALVPVAMLCAFPWDRWMIGHGVFGYPPAGISGWIAGVPVEDLLLFGLQCVLVAQWSVLMAGRDWLVARPSRLAVGSLRVGVVVPVVVAGLLTGLPHLRYVTGIVLWFGPLLAVQTILGADVLLARWRLWLAAVAPVTAWLWLVEIVALRQGIWWVAPADSLSPRPAGVPVEDLLIFLVGTLFVAQTVIYADDPVMRARARGWLRPRSAKEA